MDWFRLYSEFSTDPKVQMMPEAFQRRYVMLLCMRCSNVLATLHATERDSAIAFHLRISDSEWHDTKAVFISKGFIDEDCELLNWNKRQYASDSSTERSRKHRDAKKRQHATDATLQERSRNALDTDTDTEVNHLTNPDGLVVASSADDQQPEPDLGLDTDPKKSTVVPNCPQQALLDLYAECLPELPQPRAWEGQASDNLRARWRWVLTATKRGSGERYATTADEGVEWFRRFFGYVAGSDFLMGRKADWQADLRWLVKAANFDKVLSGAYENGRAAA